MYSTFISPLTTPQHKSKYRVLLVVHNNRKDLQKSWNHEDRSLKTGRLYGATSVLAYCTGIADPDAKESRSCVAVIHIHRASRLEHLVHESVHAAHEFSRKLYQSHKEEEIAYLAGSIAEIAYKRFQAYLLA